jgi:UDPglucose--hexose-1-phosphate uridylyltransferase
MSELRKDPIVGRWVIIAENRAQRPHEFLDSSVQRGDREVCPFCVGNERHTPDEIAAHRQPGTRRNEPGWNVRVVPNKFPALEMAGDPHPRGDGLYEAADGVGVHEVIIESPRHLTRTTELSDNHLAEVLWICRERLLALQQDSRLVHGLIFKNVGAAAGASLAHLHSQLIVTPIVPVSVAEEIDGSHAYFRKHDRCVYCDLVEQEQALAKRIVLKSPQFVAFCPFAARFPFETWIVPTSHASHYESLSRAASKELAGVLRRVLAKIDAALARPAYNYIVHTAPFDTPPLRHYHWHIEIIPRVTKLAGFEWGSGFYINPVPPEEAAGVMREIVTAPQETQEFPTRATG